MNHYLNNCNFGTLIGACVVARFLDFKRNVLTIHCSEDERKLIEFIEMSKSQIHPPQWAKPL